MERISAKMTSKGQITLPAKLRTRLGVKPGDRIDFVEGEAGRIEILARSRSLADLRGILPYDGPPLSDADIVDLVDEARSQRAAKVLDSARGRK